MRQRDNVTLLNQVDESGMITVTSSFNRNVWIEIQGKLTLVKNARLYNHHLRASGIFRLTIGLMAQCVSGSPFTKLGCACTKGHLLHPVTS